MLRCRQRGQVLIGCGLQTRREGVLIGLPLPLDVREPDRCLAARFGLFLGLFGYPSFPAVAVDPPTGEKCRDHHTASGQGAGRDHGSTASAALNSFSRSV